MTTHSTRREFLQRSSQTVSLLAATAALGGVHAFGAEQPATVRLGIIGCGAMMTVHVRRLVNLGKKVSIAWLCDVDPRQTDKMSTLVTHSQSAPPKTTAHFEDVFADSGVDACIIATPHHWHAPIALAAMRAGKDVYIEKPFSHVYSEGPLIIAAAKKYGRVVQQGTQTRSSPVTDQAGKLLKDGVIGKVMMARAWTAETRPVVQPVPDSAAPAAVDYDRWLGPAPKRPFNELRFDRTWQKFRDYANGDIGNDGVHDLDMATWGLNAKTLPTRITARGGRMLPDNVNEFPDNMNVTYEYSDGRLLIYETYSNTPYGIYNVDNGNVFYGTEGYMVFSRRGFFNVYLGPKAKPGPTESKELRGQRGYAEHMADFLTAVRHRTPTRASAETAHLSCALVHLGNVVSLTRGQLDFDPATEKFRDCDEADRLLTKQYRQPYGLPESS